jgi:hypothetical protein
MSKFCSDIFYQFWWLSHNHTRDITRVRQVGNMSQAQYISLIHSIICLTTGPMPLPKRLLHIMRSRASSFKWEYPLLSLRSSSSFLRLLVASISPFICPSITCFRRQFRRKMWPIQLAFRFLISRRIFLCSLTLSNTFKDAQLESWSEVLNVFEFYYFVDCHPLAITIYLQWVKLVKKYKDFIIFWAVTG